MTVSPLELGTKVSMLMAHIHSRLPLLLLILCGPPVNRLRKWNNFLLKSASMGAVFSQADSAIDLSTFARNFWCPRFHPREFGEMYGHVSHTGARLHIWEKMKNLITNSINNNPPCNKFAASALAVSEASGAPETCNAFFLGFDAQNNGSLIPWPYYDAAKAFPCAILFREQQQQEFRL